MILAKRHIERLGPSPEDLLLQVELVPEVLVIAAHGLLIFL